MKNQMIKDLPIYINGFVVTCLLWETECNVVDIIMYGLAITSFLWHDHNQKTKI